MKKLKKIEYVVDPAVMKILVNVKATIRDAETGKVKRVKNYHNLVVTAGKAAIAEFLGRSTPSFATLSPNYCAVGTGTNAPAAGNTALQTETARTVIASKSFSSNVVYLTGFFGATDVSGTLREVGLLINATSTSGTGTLFNRVAINVTKAITETLTIDFTITIT